MDELVISGKRYISSRRAAKENRYHTDYIGQLVRARKIAGKKVGRAWYIDAESLSRYVQAEKNGTEADIDADEFVEVPQPEEEALHTHVADMREVHPKREAEETISVGFSTQYSPVQPLMPKPHAPAPTPTMSQDIHVVKPALQYIADDEPFVPKISQYEEVVVSSIRAEAVTSRPIAQAPIPHKKTSSRTWNILPVFVVGMLLIIGFFASTALRYKIVTNQSGTTASVILSR